ncbi:neuroglobin-like [Tubulanus polymorphus]|uniref:neuroglobin-like n=1 Tax=Tubulanus polymorphus TaxID=672921 RepID=UPI003DA3D049
MGCYQTKSYTGAKDTNGKVNLNSIPEPTAPPESDPRLPLNSREIFKLQKSWKAISRNMQITGIEMFIRIFEKDSNLKSLFHGFRDIDNSYLRDNEALEGHAGLVMTVVDDAIQNINNVDYVLDLLSRTGGSHTRFEGFDVNFFYKLEEPFIGAVKMTLEERFNPNIESIYVKIIKFIIDKLVKSFQNKS